MNKITIIFIALGLSMDTFVISISNGLAIKNLKINHAIKIALFFSVVQGVMPLIGSIFGLTLKKFIADTDHWIAFIILLFIGGRMIYESVKQKEIVKKIDPLNNNFLLLLAVSTSIDALAVGITFPFLQISIFTAGSIIGIITFIVSFIGVYIGNKSGHFFENKIEIAAGLVLIGIGIKILFEHLNF